MDKLFALLFLIVAVGLLVDHESQKNYNRGVAVTQALDQKEGEIWVNQQLAKKDLLPSDGKAKIKCESAACLKAMGASQ